ncbi:hypothetical protein MANES_12G039850v8 [Manihot esculenta]|uniref:Uncharacterized protein n=1 Tax=Manihot esculenta TaxID=3983 RepID=A0ACB7GPI4_MANES|nr:hypothetical protein MANES_12G039850v8 [Manihot esculenta]
MRLTIVASPSLMNPVKLGGAVDKTQAADWRKCEDCLLDSIDKGLPVSKQENEEQSPKPLSNKSQRHQPPYSSSPSPEHLRRQVQWFPFSLFVLQGHHEEFHRSHITCRGELHSGPRGELFNNINNFLIFNMNYDGNPSLFLMINMIQCVHFLTLETKTTFLLSFRPSSNLESYFRRE